MVLMLYGGQPLDLAHYPSLMNAAIYYDIRGGGGVLNGAHRKGESLLGTLCPRLLQVE